MNNIKKIGFMIVRRDMRIDWVNWTKKKRLCQHIDVVVYFGVFSGRGDVVRMADDDVKQQRAGHKMGSGQGFTLCTLYMFCC